MNGIGLLRAESGVEHDRSYLHKNDRAYHSGSLLLGAAGLLQGYKATSHWAAREASAHSESSPPTRAWWSIVTVSPVAA